MTVCSSTEIYSLAFACVFQVSLDDIIYVLDFHILTTTIGFGQADPSLSNVKACVIFSSSGNNS